MQRLLVTFALGGILLSAGCGTLMDFNPFASSAQTNTNEAAYSQFAGVLVPTAMRPVPKRSHVTIATDGNKNGVEVFEGPVKMNDLATVMARYMERESWHLLTAQRSANGEVQIYEQQNLQAALHFHGQGLQTVLEVWVGSRLSDGQYPLASTEPQEHMSGSATNTTADGAFSVAPTTGKTASIAQRVESQGVPMGRELPLQPDPLPNGMAAQPQAASMAAQPQAASIAAQSQAASMPTPGSPPAATRTPPQGVLIPATGPQGTPVAKEAPRSVIVAPVPYATPAAPVSREVPVVDGVSTSSDADSDAPYVPPGSPAEGSFFGGTGLDGNTMSGSGTSLKPAAPTKATGGAAPPASSTVKERDLP